MLERINKYSIMVSACPMIFKFKVPRLQGPKHLYCSNSKTLSKMLHFYRIILNHNTLFSITYIRGSLDENLYELIDFYSFVKFGSVIKSQCRMAKIMKLAIL